MTLNDATSIMLDKMRERGSSEKERLELVTEYMKLNAQGIGDVSIELLVAVGMIPIEVYLMLLMDKEKKENETDD